MKKVLSLVLVIALVLSSMVTAFAAPADIADSDYETAIETLVAFGVLQGYPDGTFKPEREIKRAEIAKVLVEALGYGNLAAGATSNFSDTQGHWASGYIAIAANINLVTGYPDGTFKPEQTVRYNEALAMVVRALGYTDGAVKGNWPTNYVVKATDLGLIKGVKIAEFADRGGVAQIFYNALEALLVEVDADNKVSNIVLTQEKDGKVIYKALIDQLGTKDEFSIDADSLDSSSKKYLGDVVNLNPYMYQTITAYANKDGDVVYVKNVESLVLEGKVTASKKTEITVEDAKEDKYTLDVTSSAAILLNGEEVKYETFADKADALKNAKVTLVLQGENGDKVKDQKVTGVVARLVTDTVQADEEYVKDEVELGSVVLPVKDKKVNYDKLVVTGDADSLEDIEEDDVLALYYGKGDANKDRKLEIHVTRKTVEGKVTRVNNDKEITISGTVYKPFEGSTDDVKVGDEIVAFLTQDGKVFAYEFVDAKVAEDYAVVLEVKDGYERTNGTRLAEPSIKLLTASGEKVTYVIDDSSKDVKDVAKNDDGDIIVDYEKGNIVEYNLDGKEIDGLKKVGEEAANIKTSGNSFNVLNNAAIFNLPKAKAGSLDEVDNAQVVKVDELKDTVYASVVKDKDGRIVAMVVYGVVGEKDDVYALVVSRDATVLDDKDKEVVEYITFVDGKKVTYLGDSKTIVSNTTPSGVLVELTIEGGRLVGAKEVTNVKDEIKVTARLEAKDSRINNYISVEGGSNVYLANDVVVYVVEEDGDIVLGSKSDIRGNEFIAYNLNLEDTDDYGIVVVFEK